MLTAWVLTAVVFSLLFVFWRMLNFTFDLIEKAHRELRAPAEPRNAGAELTGSREP